MRLSLVVEADYTDLADKDALTREKLVANLRLLAQRIEIDYRERNSQQNKYGIFFQVYNLSAGSGPARNRADSAPGEVLKQMTLETNDPTVTPVPEAGK